MKDNTLPQLVIFDCDGVLVESEAIANRVFAEMVSKEWDLAATELVTEHLDDALKAEEEGLPRDKCQLSCRIGFSRHIRVAAAAWV